MWGTLYNFSKKKLFLLLAIILSTTMIFSINELKTAAVAGAVPPASISAVFPDPALAEAVRVELGKSSVSDMVTQTELDSITRFSLNSQNITSLVGMEYLTQLTNLWLDDNNISDLVPLSHLENLKTLDMNYNKVSDLTPLSGLTGLSMLHLSVNNISDLTPISGLTNLISLGLNGNSIADISVVANFSALEYLHVSNNAVSDIQPIRNLVNLQAVGLNGNRISDISVITTELHTIYRTDIMVNDQQITNDSLNYQQSVSIPNMITYSPGTLIDPDQISDGGSYSQPNVVWNLTDYVPDLSYHFSSSTDNADMIISYSGTITQPLLEAFTLSFNTTGSSDVIVNQVLEAGTLATKPTTPTKANYDFVDWNTLEDGSGEVWDFNTTLMPDNDVTLYAQWTAATPDDSSNNNSVSTDDNNILLPVTGEDFLIPITIGITSIMLSGILLISRKRK